MNNQKSVSALFTKQNSGFQPLRNSKEIIQESEEKETVYQINHGIANYQLTSIPSQKKK